MAHKSGSSLPPPDREEGPWNSSLKAADFFSHRLQPVSGKLPFVGQVLQLRNGPAKLKGMKEWGQKETDPSKARCKGRNPFTSAEPSLYYLGLQEGHNKYLTARKPNQRDAMFLVSLQIPSLGHQLSAAQLSCEDLSCVWWPLWMEVLESLTFPSQVSPRCACKCQSSFFTAVRTD